MNASKILAYRTIDSDARSMRNNIVVYGMTERFRVNDIQLAYGFLQNELGLDTENMQIELIE